MTKLHRTVSWRWNIVRNIGHWRIKTLTAHVIVQYPNFFVKSICIRTLVVKRTNTYYHNYGWRRFFIFYLGKFICSIFLFYFLELIYLLKPNIFPQDLKIWINKDTKNKEVIEYLDRSPYIKFKPNVKVRIQFYRGNTNQFEYDWQTDSKGFKNLQYLSKLKEVDIVTLGDSFAEGMGVPIEETFSTINTPGPALVIPGAPGAPTPTWREYTFHLSTLCVSWCATFCMLRV